MRNETRPKRPREPQITIYAENYQDVFSIASRAKSWTKHPLIEAGFRLFKLPVTNFFDIVLPIELAA